MASSTPTAALSAASFVDSIGINIHLPYDWTSYGDLGMVENSLAYLGVANVRDSLVPWSQTQPAYQELMTLGYKFDFIIPIASIDIPGFVSLVDSYAKSNPGSVLAVEGPNEVNLWPVTYNGGSGLANAAQYQQAFYAAVRADANLSDIPVYNLSLGSSDPSLFQQLGNLSSSADFANSHAYLRDNVAPAYTENVLFPLPKIDTPGLPTVITETGYTTNPYVSYNGIDEIGQAKYTLDTLMDAYKAGISQTFLYELLDQNPDPTFTSAEDHYGVFNSDGTPKLAATALHNLTTILADPGAPASFVPGSLNYTVTNLTAAYGNQMLLEKSNGAFDLVIWAEPIIWNSSNQTDIAAPVDKVTVSFAQMEGKVFVFDPLLGTAPIATYTNVQQIQVDVTDHPLVIEVANPSAPPPAAVPTPVVAGFSPDSNVVGDGITNAKTLTLNGSAAAKSTVTLFDGAILLGTATANSSGAWTFATGILANGTHSFAATDTDSLGNVSQVSSALKVTVDTVAPNAPVIASDAIVNTNKVLLTGTAEANSTVNVFEGSAQLGTAKADGNGAWSFTTGQLASGQHLFTATDTDAAGNTSAVSKVIDPIINPVGVTINGTQSGNTIDATHGIKGLFSTNGDDTINGGAGNDTLSSLGGNDTIDGGSGTDKMIGGTGNDTYIVDNKNDQVIENANEGTDTVLSSVTETLSANVENLTLTGSSSINGTGNSLNNVIVGNSASNVLSGLGGNDVLTGGGKSDTFVFGSNFGKDIITDFQASGSSHDVLQISHNVFNSFAAVLSHAAQIGSDVVITADAADTITLKNVQLSSLQKNDIHIV